jgi:hypothetical protein
MIATPIQDMRVDYNQLNRLLKSVAYAASNFFYYPGMLMHTTPTSDAAGAAFQ